MNWEYIISSFVRVLLGLAINEQALFSSVSRDSYEYLSTLQTQSGIAKICLENQIEKPYRAN